MITLNVELVPVPILDIDFQNVEVSLSSDSEVYDGEYRIVPKIEGQVLDTAHKCLLEDITILSIPFFEVSNDSGGNTIYIGSEVNYE